MRYRLLGKNGLRVSETALGTMTFGDHRGRGAAMEEVQNIDEIYREAGGNT
jgi:aryl-alcohol dehydrogenase-like predicted oxidoreductase